MFVLIQLLLGFAFGLASGLVAGIIGLGEATTKDIVMAVAALVMFIPSWTATIRRLHDANFSGWWTLLMFVPYAAAIVTILTLLPSRPAGARFDAEQEPTTYAQLVDGRLES